VTSLSGHFGNGAGRNARRRGIASALYRLIEADLGRPLRPSRIWTEADRAFWKARKVVAGGTQKDATESGIFP
jgi:hypothetical protein